MTATGFQPHNARRTKPSQLMTTVKSQALPAAGSLAEFAAYQQPWLQPLLGKKAPTSLFIALRLKSWQTVCTYSFLIKAYLLIVSITSLKRILEVKVYPWWTIGSPSGPSQQSTVEQKQRHRSDK